MLLTKSTDVERLYSSKREQEVLLVPIMHVHYVISQLPYLGLCHTLTSVSFKVVIIEAYCYCGREVVLYTLNTEDYIKVQYSTVMHHSVDLTGFPLS